MNNIRNTPYFIMHKEKLIGNLESLKKLETLANIHLLHTLKSFNTPSITPFITDTISGISISSEKELTMAKEANAKHIHLYAPAFKELSLTHMLNEVDTLSFNSLGQWQQFKNLKGSSSKGLRINPKLQLPIPTHCNPNLEHSRLGVDTETFLKAYQKEINDFEQLEGLHFHALFQSSVEDLILLLNYLLEHFQEVLAKLKWLNLGGGHNFTKLDYDIDTFVNHLVNLQKLYPNITIYFEPGETTTKGCGEFVCTVLDIINISGKEIVILDTSVETHLLDVAIVNMKLKVQETQIEPTPYFYELTGNSCLQGDIIGQYFFTKELHIGEQVVFKDMMAYSMVKMTQFNGMEKATFYLQ